MRKIEIKKIKKEMLPDIAEYAERYPHFGIDMKHLPEAKEWKVGETYYIALQIRQTGIEMRKMEGGEEMGHASFEITGIEVKNPGKKDD